MLHNKSEADAGFGASLQAGAKSNLGLIARNLYHVVAWRRPEGCDCLGCKAWKTLSSNLHEYRDIRCRNAFMPFDPVTVPNLTTTAGKNDQLTQYFKGSGYSAAWYIGLVDNAGFSAYAAGDTMSSHAGWAESTAYSNANRPTWTGGSVSGGSVDNSGAVAAFNINATATIRGAFQVNNNTKGGTTGTLYGEADFAASRSLLSGDTLNVTVTDTLS